MLCNNNNIAHNHHTHNDISFCLSTYLIYLQCRYKELRDTIFSDASDIFESIDSVEMSGVTFTGKKGKEKKMKVSFHVEGYRIKK